MDICHLISSELMILAHPVSW